MKRKSTFTKTSEKDLIGNPPNVGVGACGIWGAQGTGGSAKTPCTKQCSWRKHCSCDTHLAQACPPKLCEIKSRRDAPRVAILEALCVRNAPGRGTERPPEALLPRNPVWESSHFSNLTTVCCVKRQKQVSLRHRRVFCLSQRPMCTPHLAPPPFKRGRSFLLTAGSLLLTVGLLLLMVNWLGPFYLRMKFGLVLFAYGGK